jgi:hypothetical protein
MFCIGTVGVFYAEVVDDEGKSDGARGMAEEARDMRAFHIAVSGEVSDETRLSEESGLWEPVHAFVDLEENGPIGEVGMKGVFLHECCREELGWKADILRARKWGSKVEVGDVGGHEVGIVGDDRVEKDFDNVEVSSARGHVTGVLDFVATCCAADATHPHTHL